MEQRRGGKFDLQEQPHLAAKEYTPSTAKDTHSLIDVQEFQEQPPLILVFETFHEGDFSSSASAIGLMKPAVA